MDETECEELATLSGNSEDEIQVIGFEYDDDDGDVERWTKCESTCFKLCETKEANFGYSGLIHFENCRRAMKSVGSRLELDLRGHDGLFEHVHNNQGKDMGGI